MSLDITPTGQDLVFDLLGDIWRLPVSGGAAIQLTHGKAMNTQPRFSPDGEKVAFVSDRSGYPAIWIMSSDGADPRLIYEAHEIGSISIASPNWSVGGESIFFWRQIMLAGDSGDKSEPTLMAVQLDSGSAEPIKDMADTALRGLSPTPTPDGKALYFTMPMQSHWDTSDDISLPVYQIGRYDFLTSETIRITSRREGAWRPIISPDGRWMVYGSRDWKDSGLRLRDLQTGKDQWFALPIDRDSVEALPDMGLLPGMAFTPDSSALIVAYGGKIRRIAIESGEHDVISFTAQISKPLAPLLRFPVRVDDSDGVSALSIQYPKLSPEGRRVAFSSMGKVWILNLDSNALTPISAPGVGLSYQPAWAPDGRSLVFCSWDAVSGGHVWTASVDRSTKPVQLSSDHESGFWQYPTMSSDGRIVASWQAQADRLAELSQNHFGGMVEAHQLRELQSGQSRIIILTRGPVEPQFSSDGNEIVFFEGRSRSVLERNSWASLRSISFDGSNLETLLTIKGPISPGSSNRAPARMTLSPDGRTLAVQLLTNSYLLRYERAGQELSLDELRDNAVPLAEPGFEFVSWSPDGTQLVGSMGATLGIVLADQLGDIDWHKPMLSEPRAIPTGNVVLANARIVTMSEAGTIERGEILVDRNRIVAVGASGQLKRPPGAKVIDLGGRTVTPGFIDAHAHASTSADGVPPIEDWRMAASLAYGITTVFDPFPQNTEYCCNSWHLSYKELIETGHMVGPRLYSTGGGFLWHESLDGEIANSVALRRKRYDYPWGKYYAAGSRGQRQQFAKASLDQRLSLVAEGSGAMSKDLTYFIDGYSGHEHMIPLAPLYRDVAEFIARSGTSLTPTLLVARGEGAPSSLWHWLAEPGRLDLTKLKRFTPMQEYGRNFARRNWAFDDREQAYSTYASAAGRIADAGGLILVGGHGEVPGAGYHFEMWSLSAGMSNTQVLRAATRSAAIALGLDQDLGSIETGKLADLIVFSGDPTKDIYESARIDLVIKNGVVYDGESLDEVYPNKRSFDDRRWWSATDNLN